MKIYDKKIIKKILLYNCCSDQKVYMTNQRIDFTVIRAEK